MWNAELNGVGLFVLYSPIRNCLELVHGTIH